ncbi:Virulence protein [Sedimentisphaera cyanobacteriorum]|uniref:Virulence protein n=1 Tax=Sedimentisphaera cyanobacteriorum TaxID=1940790 RepID=A0A1Q2HRD0_9BACT|nr:virulence RhuM family protein [Sedimentisphaera cyanobacteriorum]AQQ09824.1 Virulence protein [Sedimentisphaera cyanobacteriorum]
MSGSQDKNLSGQNDIIIYNSPDGKSSVRLYSKDGTLWLNQYQIAELFATSKQNIGQHIAKILNDKELDKNSVVKNYFTTADDGKNYSVTYYALDMILAIGFRVRGKRGTQFRTWANRNLKEYMVKGFVVDDERLKNPDGRPDYFDELLERIRDIRASKKSFYQKLKDLFSLSSDYDKTDKAAQMFFAETQNKLIYAVTGKTAAELIVSRADADKPNMALTSWEGSIVRKRDIFTAKNYLFKDEIDTLSRLVTVFLETAELRAKERRDLTLDFWRDNAKRIIQLSDRKILKDRGSVSNKQMEETARQIYQQFDEKRKAFEARKADLEEIREIENQVEKRSQH